MSLLSRVKRQREAKLRKKKQPKKYQGYMTFPLTGARTPQEFHDTTRYYGDMLDPQTRFQIFKRPRLYKFEVVLVSNSFGQQTTEHLCQQVCDKAELAQVLKQEALAVLKGELDHVNLNLSYFKVGLV